MSSPHFHHRQTPGSSAAHPNSNDHRGFHEEREWRANYKPKRWSSSLMESSTEVAAAVPQIICRVPPDGSASALIADLDFTKVFDRLIIGPYP
jgi:hypothetical protein